MGDSQGDEPFAYFDPMVLTGQWADRTRVHRGLGEFTIDFLRLIPSPNDRALVARAIVAPWVAMDLRDQLDLAWRSYSESSMPEDRS